LPPLIAASICMTSMLPGETEAVVPSL